MRMLVLAMLLSAMFAPSVLADVKWEEDGEGCNHRKGAFGQRRQVGCYGMPNLEWKADPGAVALE